MAESMEILAKLFGSANKVKVLRLFVLNPELLLELKEVAARTKIPMLAAAKELHLLQSIGLVEKKLKGRSNAWQLDPNFVFLGQLRALLRNNLMDRKKELARQFSRCGKLNLLVVSGVFLEDAESRADLLLVGDRLKKGVIDKLIRALEAEIGKELRYAVMDTADFNYRLHASDKFVRDIFDYPHYLVIDKIPIQSSYPQQFRVEAGKML